MQEAGGQRKHGFFFFWQQKPTYSLRCCEVCAHATTIHTALFLTLACDMVFWMDNGMLQFRSLYTVYCLCNFLQYSCAY